MTSMAEAATRAAMAGEETLKKTTGSTVASSSNDGFQTFCRIVRPPDTFNGKDMMLFQQWKLGYVLQTMATVMPWACWRRKMMHRFGRSTTQAEDLRLRNSMQF